MVMRLLLRGVFDWVLFRTKVLSFGGNDNNGFDAMVVHDDLPSA
jgi:hypothetical protein